MSRREQDSDESSRRSCPEENTGIAFARVSESLESDVQRKRGAKVSFSGKHSPMAVVGATNGSKYREYMHEKRNEYARAEVAHVYRCA